MIREATYIVDSYVTFLTDVEGRVINITATLQNGPNDRRDETQQQLAKDVKNGISSPTDDGGHMIGARFHGPVEQINYFPQNALQNQKRTAPLGRWYAMEEEWANTLPKPATLTTLAVPGQTVRVEIMPQFQPNSTNKRPIRFDVKYWYGGVPQTDPANTIPDIFVKPN